MSTPSKPDALTAGLTAAEVLFCAEYVKDNNATRAFEVAFPFGKAWKKGKKKRKLTPASIRTQASLMMQTPAIKSHIAELTRLGMENALAVQDETSDILQRCLKELAAIAFFDVTPFMTKDNRGRPKLDIEKILADPIASKAVQFEQGTTGDGEGGVIDVYKLKKYGKLEALDKLMKYAMIAQGVAPGFGDGANFQQTVINVNFPVPGSQRKQSAPALDADFTEDE